MNAGSEIMMLTNTKFCEATSEKFRLTWQGAIQIGLLFLIHLVKTIVNQ
jgi:hypothetical protein